MAAMAQDTGRAARRQAAEDKAMAKRIERMRDSLEYAEAMRAIDSMDFVFEADMLVFKRGGTARVYSNFNFVSVEGDQAMVQVSPVKSGGGQNGVGGVTVDGRITNVERRVDKRGNMTLSINVVGRAISATVVFSVFEGTHDASVRISPTLNSNTITLYGKIVPREQSNIFRGIRL